MLVFISVMKVSMNEIFNIYFGIIEDNREQANIKHPLINILKLVMLAILCGMDELDKIIDYGNNKREFLKEKFSIEKIPSKSTLTRVMIMVNPKWLGLAIVGILNTLIKEKATQIMVDGKAIKSTDAMRTIDKIMNIVTVYTNTGVALAQNTVETKTNEIPVMQDLIEMLNIEGLVVTADAMHCQKETAEKIVKGKGDYVIQLKANQKSFYEDVYAMFDEKYMDKVDKDCEYEVFSTINKGAWKDRKKNMLCIK